MDEVTNAELKETFEKHAEDDRRFQEAQAIVNEEASKSRESIHKRLSELATKDDIAEMKDLMKNIKVGFGAVRFTFNNASQIGAFLLLLFGIYVFFKIGIVGLLMWARNIGAV